MGDTRRKRVSPRSIFDQFIGTEYKASLASVLSVVYRFQAALCGPMAMRQACATLYIRS